MDIKEPPNETPILVEEPDGWRRYLAGEPIHAGDVLEYFDAGKCCWLTARFESVPGSRGRAAVLILPNDTCISLVGTIRLRWP